MVDLLWTRIFLLLLFFPMNPYIHQDCLVLLRFWWSLAFILWIKQLWFDLFPMLKWKLEILDSYLAKYLHFQTLCHMFWETWTSEILVFWMFLRLLVDTKQYCKASKHLLFATIKRNSALFPKDSILVSHGTISSPPYNSTPDLTFHEILFS